MRRQLTPEQKLLDCIFERGEEMSADELSFREEIVIKAAENTVDKTFRPALAEEEKRSLELRGMVLGLEHAPRALKP